MADKESYSDDEIKGSLKGVLKIVLKHPERSIIILNDLMLADEDCPVGCNPYWKQDGCKPTATKFDPPQEQMRAEEWRVPAEMEGA